MSKLLRNPEDGRLYSYSTQLRIAHKDWDVVDSADVLKKKSRPAKQESAPAKQEQAAAPAVPAEEPNATDEQAASQDAADQESAPAKEAEEKVPVRERDKPLTQMNKTELIAYLDGRFNWVVEDDDKTRSELIEILRTLEKEEAKA